MSRKGCLGCSFPVLIIIIVVALAVGVVSLLSGGLGQSLFKGVNMPELFQVGVPKVHLPPDVIFHIGGFGVTNTILSSWITVIVLVVLAWAVTHRIKLIPSRLQNLLEFAIDWLLNLCNDVAGEKYGRRIFPVITTIFLFIIINAWLSLIPGFGSIVVHGTHGEEVHLLRGANTDINFTLALALISFVFVEYLGISKGGGLRYFAKFINVKQFGQGIGQLLRGKVKSGFGGVFMGGVDMFVGMLEGISELIRIVSFTFRLFGNMLGGEILILMMLFLMPFLLAVPFYGLEMLVGAIQALIFGGLTLVFATMAVTTHEHEEEH